MGRTLGLWRRGVGREHLQLFLSEIIQMNRSSRERDNLKSGGGGTIMPQEDHDASEAIPHGIV